MLRHPCDGKESGESNLRCMIGCLAKKQLLLLLWLPTYASQQPCASMCCLFRHIFGLCMGIVAYKTRTDATEQRASLKLLGLPSLCSFLSMKRQKGRQDARTRTLRAVLALQPSFVDLAGRMSTTSDPNPPGIACMRSQAVQVVQVVSEWNT